ncbi:MAG TPA: hypothetical protein VGC79_35350, partial [Polyangiaceae bacterium]
TTQAHNLIEARLAQAQKDVPEWFKDVTVTEGLLLPNQTAIDQTGDPGMWALTDKNYDHEIFDTLKEHLGSQTHLKRGYADCALPLVLEHNCPNNAITLLWAETTGSQGKAMRPLFPRRHRHS